MGFTILVFGFTHDPLWPNQDETPEMRVARLAARAFADRVYLVSAILSTGGLLWFARAATTPLGHDNRKDFDGLEAGPHPA
jgi:hypothetical protein